MLDLFSSYSNRVAGGGNGIGGIGGGNGVGGAGGSGGAGGGNANGQSQAHEVILSLASK